MIYTFWRNQVLRHCVVLNICDGVDCALFVLCFAKVVGGYLSSRARCIFWIKSRDLRASAMVLS